MDARNTSGLVITTPTDREIVLTRSFPAPRKLAFEAWTTPEHVRALVGLHQSREARDGHLHSGMETGAAHSLNRLEAHLATMQSNSVTQGV